MFEKFTSPARDVVRGAAERADQAGEADVGEEYMLAALLDAQGTQAAMALAAIGIAAGRDEIERSLAEARRRGGISRSDAEALAGLGIDVGEIVSRVEQTHGEGALAVPGRRRRLWPFGTRLTHTPFTDGAKQVLEQSLRQALARGDKHIGDEHILLALTARPGVVADVLADHGVTTMAVLRALATPPQAKAS
ncbi:Clp protease N-terminal domain-containing protein [Streptomyces sp. SID3343]|uniref:Clp protease N-terminal domain-containing protein n=1 Tax=Streptomyces sp. SID3343 TaxID=2690260 RepID=UPI00136CA40A|nr:Clp protease N-terminal domain-containing protein [Streptomyces sp. SID3343]MYV98031.1 peptidase [Streptomyces sp. SID3343]